MVKSRSGSGPYQVTTRDDQGVTLVELLISMGILSLIMSLIVVVLSNQARETRAARENLAAIEVENAALRALADGSVCKYVLNRNPVTTFNSTRLPQTRSLGLKPIYQYVKLGPPGPPVQPGPILFQVGSSPSVLASRLTVSSIQLRINSGSKGSYLGTWIINFNSTGMLKPVRSVTVSTNLVVDDTTNPLNATITNCNSTSSPIAPCAYGSFQNGVSNLVGWVGYKPSFAEAFFARPPDASGAWGIGCQKDWRLFGCSGNTPSGWSISGLITNVNGLAMCTAEDSYGPGIMYATCCKM